MVIDSSAVMAILADETDRERFATALQSAVRPAMSSVTLLEISMVIESRYGAAGVRELDLLLREAAVETVPFDADQALMAREAWRLYGKGRHPAGLDLGNCCTYALAGSRGQPILYKGTDFSRTDALSVFPQ